MPRRMPRAHDLTRSLGAVLPPLLPGLQAAPRGRVPLPEAPRAGCASDRAASMPRRPAAETPHSTRSPVFRRSCLPAGFVGCMPHPMRGPGERAASAQSVFRRCIRSQAAACDAIPPCRRTRRRRTRRRCGGRLRGRRQVRGRGCPAARHGNPRPPRTTGSWSSATPPWSRPLRTSAAGSLAAAPATARCPTLRSPGSRRSPTPRVAAASAQRVWGACVRSAPAP